MINKPAIRKEITDYLDAHSGTTFQQMLDAWAKAGRNFHGGVVEEFVKEQGLWGRFKT